MFPDIWKIARVTSSSNQKIILSGAKLSTDLGLACYFKDLCKTRPYYISLVAPKLKTLYREPICVLEESFLRNCSYWHYWHATSMDRGDINGLLMLDLRKAFRLNHYYSLFLKKAPAQVRQHLAGITRIYGWESRVVALNRTTSNFLLYLTWFPTRKHPWPRSLYHVIYEWLISWKWWSFLISSIPRMSYHLSRFTN